MNEKQIFKTVCENDLAFFTRQAFKILEPETEYQHNWHVDVLANNLEAVHTGLIKNLDINIAPRTIKSLMVNIVYPCWVWTTDPSHKFISASYSDSLSVYFNIKRRELVKSDFFQSFWPIGIKEDIDTQRLIENKMNGFFLSTSVDGTVTGKGADTLISDDLISAQDAFSKTKREATHRWYSQSFYNRLQDKKTGRRINVNQRTHQDDVSGLIEKKYSFERLVIPMQKMEGQVENITRWKDPRAISEFMHPERYGDKEKEDEYEGLGVYGWSGQMQQSPSPLGGGIILDEWIRFYDEVPASFDQKIIVADLAFKGGKSSDYVSYQCWGKLGIYYYLIDLIRGKWNYGQSKDNFKVFCLKHSDVSYKYVEDKANGPALISELKNEIRGIVAWPEKSELKSLSKVQRVHMTSPLYQNGLVMLPKDIELSKVFVAELLGFTENGSTTGHDDMVDTSTMALIQLKTVARSRYSVG